jgi:hypothetical protein
LHTLHTLHVALVQSESADSEIETSERPNGRFRRSWMSARALVEARAKASSEASPPVQTAVRRPVPPRPSPGPAGRPRPGRHLAAGRRSGAGRDRGREEEPSGPSGSGPGGLAGRGRARPGKTRVESRCGAVAWPYEPAPFPHPAHSNRTGGFPASGSRTRPVRSRFTHRRTRRLAHVGVSSLPRRPNP